MLSVQEQSDSVGSAMYNPKVNHWPVKVDSVMMPDMGHDLKVEVRPLPKYYKDSFFAKDSTLWHSELQGGRYGIAGDPVPFSIHNDDLLTPLVVMSFIMLLLAVRRSSKFYSFQLRNFFRVVRQDSILEKESASDKRYLLVTCIHTSLILTFLFYLYAQENIGETYITYSEYILMGFYLATIVATITLQVALQAFVNKIFYAPKQMELWHTTKMMILSMGGILLSPVMLLIAYFGMSLDNALVYTAFVLFFAEIATFYKCYQIFFKKMGAFLQFFLYFCTLEVVPMLYLWGILVSIANYLKVNY